MAKKPTELELAYGLVNKYKLDSKLVAMTVLGNYLTTKDVDSACVDAAIQLDTDDPFIVNASVITALARPWPFDPKPMVDLLLSAAELRAGDLFSEKAYKVFFENWVALMVELIPDVNVVTSTRKGSKLEQYNEIMRALGYHAQFQYIAAREWLKNRLFGRVDSEITQLCIEALGVKISGTQASLIRLAMTICNFELEAGQGEASVEKCAKRIVKLVDG